MGRCKCIWGCEMNGAFMSFGASVVLIKSSSRFHRVGIECVSNLLAGSACCSDSVELSSGFLLTFPHVRAISVGAQCLAS